MLARARAVFPANIKLNQTHWSEAMRGSVVQEFGRTAFSSSSGYGLACAYVAHGFGLAMKIGQRIEVKDALHCFRDAADMRIGLVAVVIT